jgi:nucleotide-binding universal stress UspA family protein
MRQEVVMETAMLAEREVTPGVGAHMDARRLRILVATDGSKAARDAEDLLPQLALAPGSAVHVVTVLDPLRLERQKSLAGAEQVWAEQLANGIEHRLNLPGVQWSHAAPRGVPPAEIRRAADEFHADLIIVGAAGHSGVERFLLGSVSEAVARRAAQPVLVARRPARALRSVLVAVDGSEHSDRAVKLAGVLPLAPETLVTLCHVIRPFHYYPVGPPDLASELVGITAEANAQLQTTARHLLDEKGDEVFASGKRVERVLREGVPADEILTVAAERHADVIVIGARGVSPVEAWFLGSVADRVLRHAHCSVLLAR